MLVRHSDLTAVHLSPLGFLSMCRGHLWLSVQITRFLPTGTTTGRLNVRKSTDLGCDLWLGGPNRLGTVNQRERRPWPHRLPPADWMGYEDDVPEKFLGGGPS
jgi:hypothetical protein